MRFSIVFALLASAAITAGCAEGPDTSDPTTAADQEQHDHTHDAPSSYSAAVAEIKKCRDEVQQAFDAGTPDACDDALHVAAEALDAMAGLAEKSNFAMEDVKAVKGAAKELFDHFAEIHRGFHGGGEGASFADVAEKIDEGIAVLDSKLELIASSDVDGAHANGHSHEDHDDAHEHDHADHDHEDHDHNDEPHEQ
jgi:hypothetical protein